MQTKHVCGFCVALLLMTLVVAAGVAQAADYNYISVADFKARMDAGDHENGKMAIMTSQTEEEYATGHLKAAFATFARPWNRMPTTPSSTRSWPRSRTAPRTS